MKNILKLLPIKIILIFIVTVLGSWIMRNFFGGLYVFIVKPEITYSSLFLIDHELALRITGFLIAYAFWGSLLSFLFCSKKQWLVWLIIMLPLLIISFGLWMMFVWYVVMLIVGWLLAQGILLIYKKMKKS
ncbi:hypothetical protein KAU19_00745 [Candidatus Parcubacteria bacterium]|nr:hypothetical protein [Candidatus Parcubacteria bacterium]